MDHEFDVFFLPYFTPSHMIPLVDMGRLFATRGVNVTIVTTPCNAALFQASVDRDIASGSPITVHTLKFPSVEAGVPEGIENFNAVTSLEMATKVSEGISMLQKPMEQLIRDCRPDCIVSDMFFPWTVDVAEELKVPRILFNPSNFLFHCVTHSIKIYSPHEKIQSDTESFVIPGLPDKIEITRAQLPDHVKTKTRYGEIMDMIRESERRSFGTIINSFYEIEPSYVDHFRTVLGRKGWHVGPLSHFSNRGKIDIANDSIIEQHSCLSWLDTQKPNSILYICFGSMIRFPDSQLTQIALALDASGKPFVWVVRKRGKTEENEEEGWLPKGFEGRMAERNQGVIIRGWAPQLLILEHYAIGGFMTHCGWNSILEGVTAGVPLIAWPLFAEQFYNEKLVTQVLKIGVGAGADVWNTSFEITSPVVGKDKIEKAVTYLMGCSKESEQIRRRAKELGVMAKRAVEEGGSSYHDLTALIEEIKVAVAIAVTVAIDAGGFLPSNNYTIPAIK
ncbi:hypothetical protein F0562_035863 [Nyssa sinensis]|uniref:Glycosyltransferase n=1 Tax=Nyssa sinensis TaxID=561372 RepID=A0A5J5AE91_9ASTE|nr:hypothetical protein F0562_035863 [Nyssa sinensis]